MYAKISLLTLSILSMAYGKSELAGVAGSLDVGVMREFTPFLTPLVVNAINSITF